MSPPALCLLGPVLLWAAWALGCPDPSSFQNNFEEEQPIFPTHRRFSAFPAFLLFLIEHGTESLLKPCNQEALSVLSSGG